MLYADITVGDDLATYISSLSNVLFQEVEDYVSDDPVTGAIGYSAWVDVNRVPDVAIPWLAQFVGVELIGGISIADQRQQITDLANWRRGTVQSIRDSPKPFLSGTKTVVFRERYGGPYKLTVITYTSETVDPIAAYEAIIAQKPGGITLTYSVNSGQDYESVRVNNATYSALRSNYATYSGVKLALPGV